MERMVSITDRIGSQGDQLVGYCSDSAENWQEFEEKSWKKGGKQDTLEVGDGTNWSWRLCGRGREKRQEYILA